MLDLTPTLTQLTLEALNDKERVAAWNALLEGDEFKQHLAQQAEHYDTTFSMWHREAKELFDSWLEELARSLPYGAERPLGASLLGHWLRCEDAFALSDTSGSYLDEWVKDNVGRRPMTAVRVGTTVFFMSGKGKARWRARPWLASSPREENRDPLMTLPYQRKYDFERHGRVDLELRDRAERLHVAYDLLTVLSERIEDTEIAGFQFEWPERADITDELAQLGLCLSGGLGFGPPAMDLAELTRLRDDEPRVGRMIEHGGYRGALGGYHRRPSGRLRPSPSAQSVKWMLMSALTELRTRLSELCSEGDTSNRFTDGDED